jgi:hypothetical protein
MQSFERAGLAPERADLGRELVDLGARHELVTFEVLGHLVLIQAYSALADFAAADQHAAAVDQLGERYQIPLVSVFTRWYQALRTAATGQSAEVAYRAAAARLTGTGMPGLADGILPLALLCDRIQQGQRPDPDQDTQCGVYGSWCRPLISLAARRMDEARATAASIPDSPRDLLYEARTCLHAVVAIELDDRPTMARLYADLQPAADELAGAGSGLLTLRPVAHYLGDLATALGLPREAAEHYRRALAIATRAGGPHWVAAARDALRYRDSAGEA